MYFNEKTFTDTSKITTNELNLIYLRFCGEKANTLNIIKGMPSCVSIERKPDYYCADSSDGWEFLQEKFGRKLKGQQIYNIPELYSHMIDWCYRNQDKL